MASLSWSHIRARLVKTMSPDEFKRWIQPLRVTCQTVPQQDIENKKVAGKNKTSVFTVSIRAENKYKLNWVRNHYDATLMAIIRDLCKSHQFVPEVQYIDDRRSTKRAVTTAAKSPSDQMVSTNAPSIDLFSSIWSHARFTNFIEGDVNRVAKNMALSIPNAKKRLGHLFIFYGGSGLGKTHLLQAIANELLKKTDSVIYVGGEVFIRALYHYLARKAMERFKDVYRHVDVLVMDDMHFLKGKPKAQEELLHTLDERERKKKTLVLATDIAPKQMDYFSDALRSRLMQALTVRLDKPNTPTAAAIIRQKCLEKQLDLSPKCVNQIVPKISGNVREIEGIVKLIRFYVDVYRRPADLPMLKTVFKNIGNIHAREPTLDEIRQVTEKHYDLPADELKRTGRKRTTAAARQLAMFLVSRADLAKHHRDRAGLWARPYRGDSFCSTHSKANGNK